MQTLKTIIRKYMLLLTLFSVSVMLIVIVCIQMSIEQKNAYENSMKTLSQIEQVLEDNRKELIEIRREYRQNCLNHAETIARIIEGTPEMIYDVDALKEIAKIVGVDEIHFFDDTGCIFAGTHPEYYGFTFDSGEQMRFFKPMLKDKSKRIVQDITPNTAEGKLMQYSAIWSKNGDIIIQVGMEPVSVMKVTEKNELSYIFSLFRVNPDANYYAIDAESGEIVGATDLKNVGMTPQEIGISFEDMQAHEDGHDGFFAKVNGQKSYCVFKLADDIFLGYTISTNALYQRIPINVFQLTACLALIVLILSWAVTIYMNKFVVEKLRNVNEKLHSIAIGNLDEQIDIQSSQEFSELSSYLNSMIKSLLNNIQKMSYVLGKTNMYIGVYDYNLYTKKIHYTEHLPKLLELDRDQMKEIASDFDLFHTFMDAIRQNPIADEPGIFLLSEEPERYVKLEEVTEQDEVWGIVIDMTSTILRRRKIEQERDLDPLTGLYNRRGLDSKLNALFREPEKLGYSAFVMLDADGLKEVNDTYGHQKGDIYLKKVAEIIKNFGERSSIASRQGGDEFVLFLYHYATEDELLRALESLEQIQYQQSACIDDVLCIPVRFSFGYCLTRANTEYSTLIKEADKNMYANKRQRKETLPPDQV